MINTGTAMATTSLSKPLPGHYALCVLRHWNAGRAKEESWILVKVDRQLHVTPISVKAISDEVESIINRHVPVVDVAESLNPDRAPIARSAHWIAGPITEREVACIKELSRDSSQT